MPREYVHPDPANVGRRGRRWRDFRALVFATYGRECWVCGHEGSNEVDHLRRLADGGGAYDLENARPAHGSNAPCPVCVGARTGRPRCCNQERSNGDDSVPLPQVELYEMITDPGSV